MSDWKIVVIWEDDIDDMGADEILEQGMRLEHLEIIIKKMLAIGLKPQVGDVLAQEGMYNEVMPWKDGTFQLKQVRFVLNDNGNITLWATV